MEIPVLPQTSKPQRLLGLAEVMPLASMSRASIYAAIKRKAFPAPVRVSARRVAWRESDVLAWQASLQKDGVA